MLLLARGRLVSKDELAEALWPGDFPKNVTGTLETYVSVLRRHLFEDRSQARRVVVTASGAYRFALDEVTLDIETFDDLLVRAERAERAGHRRALLMEAVSLAAGDLLEDEPYALWVQADRELYRGRVAAAYLQIAEDALVAGDLDVALRHGEAALARNPFGEKALRAVMLANHALGNTETSRLVFARCRDAIQRELGLAPAAETVALAGAIDAGTPAHDLIPGRRAPSTPEGWRVGDRRDPSRRMPFVGRVPELARLRAHVEASHRGRFGAILVEGRPGFGRTTMLDRLQSWLPGAVGRASYSPRDLDHPSLPLATALVDALRSSAGAAEAERYSKAPWLSGVEDALESLHELVHGHSPLVLLLDDLHWADPDTLKALEWLQRRGPEVRLAIIATARLSTPGEDSPLGRLSGVDRLRLDALGLADSFGPHGVDQELVRIAGGNPRLMADIWRWNQGGRPGWPPSLEDAVKRRARGLGGPIQRLLQTAAAVPEPFDLIDLVDASLDAGERGMAADLERLSELGFIETTTGGFRFAEPVVRDVIATTVAPRRRAQVDAAPVSGRPTIAAA